MFKILQLFESVGDLQVLRVTMKGQWEQPRIIYKEGTLVSDNK